MKKHNFINYFLLITMSLLWFAETACAITVSAPATANVNQSVSVTISSTYLTTPNCSIEVNFGDGTVVNAPTCFSTPCNQVLNHTYTAAGNYTITASGLVNCVDSPPVAPDPATANITIQAGPVTSFTISPIPASLSIPRGGTAVRQIIYNANVTPAASVTLQSTQGAFYADNIDSPIWIVTTPLQFSIINGIGRVAESLTIPVSMLKRIHDLNISRITYRRSFSSGPAAITVNTPITITTSAGADFSLTGIRLFYDNYRSEVTIERNQRLPKIVAQINFNGSGLLQGFWEVDGKVFSSMSRHLTFGRTVTIVAPSSPTFPTHNTGTHRIRFVVTSPNNSITFPTALYFVKPATKNKMNKIVLTTPEDDTEIFPESAVFKWKGERTASIYYIEFMESDSQKVIFSAYTKKSDYTIHDSVLKRHFKADAKYDWRVRQMDLDGSFTGESPIYTFTFSWYEAHYPGRVVIAIKNKPAHISKMKTIAKQMGLKLFDEFSLKSANLFIQVYDSTDPLTIVLKKLKSYPFIIEAQPDYIFQTLSEPLREMQALDTTLKLKKVHKAYTGKGVKVAVIDTGVDTSHSDLKRRVKTFSNLVKGDDYKGEIHGTGVAGVIAADINGFGMKGVAPGATVIALRSCRQISDDNPTGECYTSSIVKAIDIAIRKKADIVNMSFGAMVYDRLIASLLKKGAERNIVFVAPVGNDKSMRVIGFPARHPAVLAVSGTDDNGEAYPNEALCNQAEISAPAINVFTTIPDNNHNYMSGTSISSAIVTGILTLATEKKKSFNLKDLPKGKSTLCEWETKILEIPICEK